MQLHPRTEFLLYDKRSFAAKKSKKKWSFHCLNCEKKIESDGERSHYYVWNEPEFGMADSPYQHLLMCSKECIHEMLRKLGIDIEKLNIREAEIAKEIESWE